MSYKIRKALPKELSIFLDWADKEGWNPGLHDAGPFLFTDPEGFLVGELDDEVIAVKSAVRYNDEFGFMGFYIVKPEFRGKGYGYQIWKAGFDRLKDIPSGMDGVVDQQHNYVKSGYEFAYRQIRFEGKEMIPKKSFELSAITEADMCNILDYDKTIFPATRGAFLKEWLFMPDSYSLKAGDGINLSGYGTIRLCTNGSFKVGPLFADDPATARTLFLQLVDYAEGKPVYLDVSEVNSAAMELAKSQGMKYVFETARMYAGGNPERRREKIFGVTTFELG